MAIRLNIDGTSYNQYVTQIIDSTEYILHFYYNSRNSGWYMSFYDSDLYDTEGEDNTEALILGGRRLMPYQDVLLRASDDRLPKGQLVCVDTDLEGLDVVPTVSLNNFGKDERFNLIYFSESDVAELSL
jgi:hypothetical protein